MGFLATNTKVIFTIKDNADENSGTQDITISISPGGFLEIKPDGYGENQADPGCGAPILIELYEGRLVVRVADDINYDGFRHNIDLEGAREGAREPGEEEDEDEDEEGLTDPEPGEEDLITGDHVKFYEKGNEHRGPVVTVPEGEDWRRHVWDYMNSVNFWPSVWFISDHGNAHLMVLKSQDD